MIATFDQAPPVETRTDSVKVRTREPLRPAPVLMAVAMSAAAVTSVAAAPAPAFFIRPAATSTTWEAANLVSSTSSSLTSDALVRSVRESADLTWDQLARIFGVSRRSVHNWAAGERMSAHNLELLGRLKALIGSLAGPTPEARRLALFAPDAEGISPIDAFRQMAARSGHDVAPRVASQEALFDV